ncbi:ABC transporter ATP-binding protein [Phycicoccus sp. BSK3Z-2]|uniref:ABC transporter ATP-binding protein n=1 Tax=Phycicoccus avicenniae TaxID=2828860 RepID=A0A941DA08_9MICO|nr:ABC transporter ATP-binding protein [Phycicoccus avicenniae]MBR7742602.1 ABC transporter ATP-binding protein [Phycicoccus avicenniae]
MSDLAQDTPDTTSAPADVPVGDPTVSVRRLSVHYRVPSGEDDGSGQAPGRLRRRLGMTGTVTVRAVDDVSFVARAGEAIGVVGQNGSGKSTLLRVIAGLETATHGDVLATSTPMFLGVNAALMPELSGLQNVRLGLLAMGRTPAEADEIVPDVLHVAGIGNAVHRPMKTYSSGMGARLRFAIAASARPEILLIDEALATGDAASKERSEERMAQIRQQAGTIFLVSHAAQTIEEMCTRAIWLHDGELVLDGPAEETARAYRWWAWNVAKGEHEIAADVLERCRARLRATLVRHEDQTGRHIARHST